MFSQLRPILVLGILYIVLHKYTRFYGLTSVPNDLLVSHDKKPLSVACHRFLRGGIKFDVTDRM